MHKSSKQTWPACAVRIFVSSRTVCHDVMKVNPRVKVNLGKVFDPCLSDLLIFCRVWKSGQNGKDYGVRLTPVSLLLAPIKNGKHENSLPGLCCICPPGCCRYPPLSKWKWFVYASMYLFTSICRCCLPRGPEIEIFSKDIVVCRPSQGHQDTTAFLKWVKLIKILFYLDDA